MHHLNENTYILMTTVIGELTKLVRQKQARPGPLTHDEDVALRKADEVRQVALSEAISSNSHINLGDLVYKVRESEGLGWDGPSVTAWSDAVAKLGEAIRKAKGESR